MKKGFTFIEMVVVVATLAMALPALFSIIFILINQQTKIIRLTEVKRQGDYAMRIMENLVRNYATSTHTGTPATDSNQACLSDTAFPGTTFTYFKDNINGSTFGFNSPSDNIASQSATTTELTNSKVKVSGFSLKCTRSNPYSPPMVSIYFTIEYNTTSTRPEDTTALLKYQSAIQLRSY